MTSSKWSLMGAGGGVSGSHFANSIAGGWPRQMGHRLAISSGGPRGSSAEGQGDGSLVRQWIQGLWMLWLRVQLCVASEVPFMWRSTWLAAAATGSEQSQDFDCAEFLCSCGGAVGREAPRAACGDRRPEDGRWSGRGPVGGGRARTWTFPSQLSRRSRQGRGHQPDLAG